MFKVLSLCLRMEGKGRHEQEREGKARQWSEEKLESDQGKAMGAATAAAAAAVMVVVDMRREV